MSASVAEKPDQPQANAEIVTEVERLRWRARNGKAKDARITLKRLRTLLPATGIAHPLARADASVGRACQ